MVLRYYNGVRVNVARVAHFTREPARPQRRYKQQFSQPANVSGIDVKSIFYLSKMPKHQVTCEDRAIEFQSEGFVVSGGILFCKYCNYRLDYRRKDSLQKHCQSEKHLMRKFGKSTESRLATVEETLQNSKKVKDSKDEFILDTVEAFIKANIPVEKLDHPAIRAWLNKYVQGSGDLPSANRLRQHYIPAEEEAGDTV